MTRMPSAAAIASATRNRLCRTRRASRRSRCSRRYWSPIARQGISGVPRSRSRRPGCRAGHGARSAARLIDEQAVDDRPRTRDVRAERPEAPKLLRERRGCEVVRRERGEVGCGREAGERLQQTRAAVVVARLAPTLRRRPRRRPPSSSSSRRRAARAGWRRPAAASARLSVVPSPVPSCGSSRRKNGTSAPSDAAIESSSSVASGVSSRSFARRSAAAASLEPPPSPAATGIRLSMRASNPRTASRPSGHLVERGADERVVVRTRRR